MSEPLRIGGATLLLGDVREVLRTLPDESVHCCVTSPPYWNLRDYGVAGQIGMERTPEEYVATLVSVFAGVRRVLRSDGSLWLNLGDCFASTGASKSRGNRAQRLANGRGDHPAVLRRKTVGEPPTPNINPISGLKPKDLVGIPWRVAFALQETGWWLRSDIIWHKPNPMPESVLDRPTRAHEYLFLLTKSERYFYDADAIREPLRPKTLTTFGTLRRSKGNDAGANVKADNYSSDVPERKPRLDADGAISGSNRRSVWTIAPEPFSEAHFATFPTALVEPCIKAGTSEFGCCDQCGAPRVRIVERTPMVVRETSRSADVRNASANGRTAYSGTMTRAPSARTLGCGCGCGCGCGPATVLDPFSGAATTGVVALAQGRKYIGIELSPEYLAIAERRLLAATAQGSLFDRRPA